MTVVVYRTARVGQAHSKNSLTHSPIKISKISKTLNLDEFVEKYAGLHRNAEIILKYCVGPWYRILRCPI